MKIKQFVVWNWLQESLIFDVAEGRRGKSRKDFDCSWIGKSENQSSVEERDPG